MVVDVKILATVLAGFCVIVSACRNDEDVPTCVKDEGRQHVGAEYDVGLSQSESCEAEFHRIVLGKAMTVDDIETKVNDLCNMLVKTVDEPHAVRLLDRLCDMALRQPLDSSNYTKRQDHLLKLWHVTLNAFVFAQSHRQESFGEWDRLFKFFNRYTDEIKIVEESLSQSSAQGIQPNSSKEHCLIGLKGDLKIAISVMKRFFVPPIVNGLSDEQKSDILRRFDELERYTLAPANFQVRNK